MLLAVGFAVVVLQMDLCLLHCLLQAGVQDSLMVSRTTEGMVGTAGQWPSPGRRIAGIISQSPVLGDSKHSALMSIINVTFQGYNQNTQFYALESCGKCKEFQVRDSPLIASLGRHSFLRAKGCMPHPACTERVTTLCYRLLGDPPIVS
jgi:hypothetical protein